MNPWKKTSKDTRAACQSSDGDARTCRGWRKFPGAFERTVLVLRENALVPWKPKFPPVAVHPAQEFDFCVAEVSGVGGRTGGHLLVFAEPYARQSGRLWWKTLSDACLTLEVWSSIDGEFDESILVAVEDVDAAVDGLRRDEWQVGGTASTTYLLRWLDLDESRRVSADVFGVDLEAERRRRKRLD
jgi:hypothetical protein